MIQIEVEGAAAVSARLAAAPQRIMSAVIGHIRQGEVVPLVTAIRVTGYRFPGSAKLAALTVGMVQIPGGASVGAPMRPGVGAQVFMGAEFGGRRRPKRPYVTHSRSGRAYIVRRRTTRQFPPYLGTHGYWFFPTVRLKLKGLRSRVQTVAVKAGQL